MSEQLIQTPGTFGENGNFLLERELGSGGMGGVYMGRDKMLDRPVAVKVMLKEYGADEEFVGRFKKEAQACARLIHPNIAQIYSYGISDGMPYISMELVAGGSLWSIMQQNKGHTDVTRVLKICQQVAQALQCASDQGLVHGDVKPENVLLDANGNAKIVDFGLAAMQKETDEIWGTPYYISPEKVKKEPIDFRADMYSLGGTLYHALTGVAPFEGDDAVAVVKKRFEGAPKKPSEIRPDLTPQIDALVMRMLELSPDKRYPSFEALIEEFKNVLTTGLSADAQDAGTDDEAAPKAAEVRTGGKTGVKPVLRGPRRMKTTLRKKTTTTAPSASSDDDIPDLPDEEDEESGGNLGRKVLLFVLGGIALIGGVIGFLVWYQIHDKAVREREHFEQVTGNIGKARTAIVETRKVAERFADEFDEFTAKALEEVRRPTKLLKEMLPDFAELMDVPPTKELLDAIASTNPPPEVAAAPAPAATNAPAATPASAAPASSAPTAVPAVAIDMALQDFDKTMAAASAQIPEKIAGLAAQLAPQVGVEAPPKNFDPKSPEAADYLKKLGAAVEKAKKAGKPIKLTMPNGFVPVPAAAPQAPKAEEKSAVKPAEVEKPKEVPTAVNDLVDLWNRAYSCQASAIRIRAGVRKILDACDSADEIKGSTDEDMAKLGEYSRQVKDMLDELKASKDVENVRKGISYIKSKGAKLVKQTSEKLRIEKLQKEREEKAKAEAEAEAARQKAAEEAHQKAIETERAAIDEKFKSDLVQKYVSLLDWKSAIRQLEASKADFKTTEGVLAANVQIRKIKDMELVQNIFILNLKGYTFRINKKDASTIRGFTVTEVDDKQIQMIGADNKTKKKLTWRKFYQNYHGNLNELIIRYVEKGKGQYRAEAKGAKMGLAKWSDAMIGAALTMQILCSDDASAAIRAEAILKEAVKQFEDCRRVVTVMFPDLKLDAATEE